ncbi:hypothetical protein PSY31_23720, partial [Shigella flexneri]|nr:hypothetical protein [Shigella flexneri]
IYSTNLFACILNFICICFVFPGAQQFHAAALLFGPHTPREYVQGSQAEWLHMQVGGSFERTA